MQFIRGFINKGINKNSKKMRNNLISHKRFSFVLFHKKKKLRSCFQNILLKSINYNMYHYLMNEDLHIHLLN